MKLLALLMVFASAAWAADTDTRLYELRTYYAAPGKLDALHARFRDHTMKLFSKHGMTNIGYWVPLDNTNNTLIYLLAYPNREAREASWKAFSTDPEWQAVYKTSQANGPLVTKNESVFLQATDYSPAVRPAKADPARVFELRTYLTPPGKLDALNARFRDHTLKLFNKHGMTNFGYWLPTDEKQGAGTTLIYLLAHPSKETRDKAFDAFRVDPDWVAVKSASEKDGSLTKEVKSVLLKPTDYSPTK
jgi:hypothetical protein